jgi:hypothetical protein
MAAQTPQSIGQTPHNMPQPDTPSPKRRRLHMNPPLRAADPSSIVVADMQNESDALHILAVASGQAGRGRKQNTDKGATRRTRSHRDEKRKDAADLADFALIKLGIVDEEQVTRLTETFFRYHHHLFVSLHRSSS